MKIKKVLQIYFVTNKKTDLQKKMIDEWSTIFNIDCFYITKKQIPALLKKPVDFIFVEQDSASRSDVSWEFINAIKEVNPNFKLIWVIKTFDQVIAPPFLKAGADDMIYLDSQWEYLKWKTIALLRRRWDSFANDNVVFHRGLIVNKIKGECMLNEKVIDLSKKEFEVLRCLISSNSDEFIERSYIYKTVWKHEDKDTTRVVQQIIQNLKKKIGADYFSIVRNKGIKLV